MVKWESEIASATREEIDREFESKLRESLKITKEKMPLYEKFVKMLAESVSSTVSPRVFQQKANKIMKALKINPPNKQQMNFVYSALLQRGEVSRNKMLETHLISKKVRQMSGVLVITVFTSPYPINDKGKIQRFSCKHDCYYCPNEPGVPRSYLTLEPGVHRSKAHEWDAVNSFRSRAYMYLVQGHPLDKIELLVLGGTWSEYPLSYQRQFVTELFYASNTFYDAIPRRKMKSLREEQRINETTRVRIIGLTLETRPDAVNFEELARMREYGCTRIQIGVQHTNDEILKRVNRGCYREDTVRAMKMVKDCGFKLDAHWMTQLPGTTPSMDKTMFLDVLYSPSLQADQWKLYPTAVLVSFSISLMSFTHTHKLKLHTRSGHTVHRNQTMVRSRGVHTVRSLIHSHRVLTRITDL